MIQPHYIELLDWAASLIIDYPQEDIPYLTKQDKWQEWGTIVVNSGIFAKYNVPPPFSNKSTAKAYKTWQEWADAVYLIMSTSPKI
jgi:hypothetical protein